MLDTLVLHNVFQKIIMNTLLISIPEEIFFVMFILFMLGEFKYWGHPEEPKRPFYIKVLLPAIATALLSNILRCNGLDNGIFLFIPPIVLYLLIVFTTDYFGEAITLKWMSKAFMFELLGFLIIGIIEFIYIPFVLNCTNLTISDLNSNILYYFITTIPARVMQYASLLYIMSRERTILKGQIFNPIISSNILTLVFSMLVLFDILFLALMFKVIMFDKAIINSLLIMQIIIIISIVLFPILNISVLIGATYYISNREANRVKNATERLQKVLDTIDVCIEGNNKNLRTEIDKIGIEIGEITDSLSKANIVKRNFKQLNI